MFNIFRTPYITVEKLVLDFSIYYKRAVLPEKIIISNLEFWIKVV